jgi:eukaryotic-like serine/threonine-protein kinase
MADLDDTQRRTEEPTSGTVTDPTVAVAPSSPEPAASAAGEAPEASAPKRLAQGTQVGRYVVLKPVGQGGMGVVYAAYDPELDRRVALKLLKPDRHQVDREPGRARLLREAQSMARVSHPNVCPVFDVGTFGDQVFVAMEFIEGTTLLQWLQQPRPWREVLRVMLEAGQGLRAAHEAGVVHRDFKPANVLLGRNGRAYVTDFGLARRMGSETQEPVPALPSAQSLADESLRSVTRTGLVLGTPYYMPPEQYLGEATDARSDQFSFCVVLYQALYGRMPFEPQQIVEVASSLSGTQPVNGTEALKRSLLREPPRDSKVPAWVKRAVLRGLALEAQQRFPSLRELLEELSQEPRRVRRRWAAVAGAATLAGLAAVGVVAQRQSQVCTGAQPLMAEAWNPQVRQKLEAAFEATSKPYAAEAARNVSLLLNNYAQQWVAQHTEACEASRVKGVQTEELLSLRVVCLERRREDLRALASLLSEADAPVVEKAVDAAYSLPALQECKNLEALTTQVRLPTDKVKRAEIGKLETKLSEVKALHDAGQYKEGLERAELLKPRVEATGYRPLRAELGYLTGMLYARSGDVENGARLLEQSFHDAEAGRADRLKVMAVSRLPYVHGIQQQWERADIWARVALSALDRLGNDELLASELMGNLGNLELFRARHQEAKAYLEKARELQERVLPPDHPQRARLSLVQGNIAYLMGDHQRAARLIEESLKQMEAILGKDHPETAQCHIVLSQSLRALEDYAGAMQQARAAVDILKKTLGAENPNVANALDQLGMSLLGLKRYAEALEVYLSALQIKQRTLGAENTELHYSYDGIGQALLGLGKAQESMTYLEKALSFSSAESASLGESGFTLAQALWKSGNNKRALREAARAREYFTEADLPQRAAAVDAWLKGTRRR